MGIELLRANSMALIIIRPSEDNTYLTLGVVVITVVKCQCIGTNGTEWYYKELNIIIKMYGYLYLLYGSYINNSVRNRIPFLKLSTTYYILIFYSINSRLVI